MMKKTNVEIIGDCVDMIYSLNADTNVRELARQREKARLDEISALFNAEAKGRASEREAIAQNLRSMGMSEEEIKRALGTE